MTLLLSMLWRAVSRLQILNCKKNLEWSWTKICCSIGALFFVISDLILSFDLFICDIPYSHPVIMLTYYVAQLGISLSVIDSFSSNEVNHLVIQHHDLLNGFKRIILFIKSVCFEDNIKLIELPNQNDALAQEFSKKEN